MKHTKDSKTNKDNCPSCQDNVFNEFLEDIENDIRMEKYDLLWKKYHKVIIACGILILGAIAVYGLWQRYENTQYDKSSMHFLQAQGMASQGRFSDAASLMGAITSNAPKNYKLLAQFSQAQFLLQTDLPQNHEQALDIYKKLFQNKKVPPYMRQVAVILYTHVKLDKNKTISADEREDLLKLLKKVCKEAHKEGIALLAQELRAILYYQNQDFKKARKICNKISDNAHAPAAMRTRVSILIQAIQGKQSVTKEQKKDD